MSDETRRDDDVRTSVLRGAAFQYRHKTGRDQAFADVITSGLRDTHTSGDQYPPAGHDHPRKGL